MKHRNYILIITFCFILSSITSFGQSKNPINTGFVFIDGEYLSAPYNINTDGKSIFINQKQICSTFETLVNISTNNEHPGFPNCLTKFSSIEEINNCFLLGKNISYVKAASLYYIDNYDYEIANDSIIEYYKNLPNIENITQKKGPFYNVNLCDGRILTMYFSVDRLKQLYPKNTKSGKIEGVNIANLIENHISNIRALLENNELLFFFSDENYNNFLVSNSDNIDLINNIIKSNYSQEVKIDSLTEILHNKILIEKLINNKSLDLQQMESLTTNSFIQDSNKIIRQDKLVKNTSEGTIAYSPERNKTKAFCPAIYETNTFGMFLTQELENVKTKIENCGFNNPILYVDYTANDNVFACDYYYMKHMADDAGFIYIAAHGGVDEGMLLTRGTTQAAITTWIADMDDLAKIDIANVPDAYKPTEWTAECYEAYASSEWASENWGTKLVENKTITILSICNGFDNGWVNACAGGACFGYQGETNFTSANTHNLALLGYMTGSSGANQFRLASLAYDKIIESNPTSNFKYIGNGEVTLCPGIVTKFPGSQTVVNSSGNGSITLDTWCNSDISLDINSYLSPISFSANNNIVITDLEWDNIEGGKSNKINFAWVNSSPQNTGIVTVYINSEQFQSTPAVFDEYHTLNTAVEPYSYSFQVNPYNEGLPVISGVLYSAQTSNYITNGTVKDTDNPENIVSVNSQGEYSITVDHDGWNGHLTAEAEGYSPLTHDFNQIFDDVEHNFYLEEEPNIYITSSSNNVYTSVPITFQAHNVPACCNYYWDFGDSGTDTDWAISTNPSYVFSVPGTYNVSLVLKNSNTGDIITTVWYEITIIPYIGSYYRPSFTTNCNVVNIGTEVFFYDNSCFPIEYRILWKWFFELGIENNESDYFYKDIDEPVPLDYLTVSHIYNTIGHKIVKLQSYSPSSSIFGLFSDVHDQYNSNWDESFSAFGGVNVINCDLTSVLFTHPLFSSGIFLGAVYDDWAYNNNTGPLYIYGGSFLFNGTANNHLNRDLPITISACNEIIITGDVEFVASGEEELILEINNSPCLQGNTQHLTKANQDIVSPNLFSCFPNPFIDVINIYISLQKEQKINISILDMLGKQFFQKTANFSKGESLIKINLSLLKPGTYIIKLFNGNINETFKIIKTY